MENIKLLSFVMMLHFTITCEAQDLSEVSFLEGTWKIENKDTYEKWEKNGDVYEGHSFKMIGGQKRIMETLTIKVLNGKIKYYALVPNQNNGNAIPFTLNTEFKGDILSFENPAHDFPKKIQYKKISGTKIHVSVSGEDNKGFSYYILKQ